MACFITLIAMLYAEENWRGKRVWQKYRHQLEAQGKSLRWADYTPPGVPDEQNAFKAPKMQEWFVRLSNPGLKSRNSFPSPQGTNPNTNVSIQVAELSIVTQVGSNSNNLDAAVDLADPLARERAHKLIEDAIGPLADGAQTVLLFLRPFNQIKPVQIRLKAENAPSVKELTAYLGDKLPNYRARIRVESSGTNTFRVSLNSSWCTAADYLAWSGGLTPDFDLMREALNRPYARMEGDYAEPIQMPIPGFVALRQVVQILSQRAQCYLLLGKPDAALHELTLVHDLCRLLEAKPAGKPITLVAAMIDVAVAGLYTSTVSDGLRLQAWREPELAALQQQLSEVRFLPMLAKAFECERAFGCLRLETSSRGELASMLTFGPNDSSVWEKIMNPKFLLFTSVPRGWVYQNAASIAFLEQKWIDALESTNNVILPRAVDNLGRDIQTAFGHFSPYTFLAAKAVPNFYKATQTLARNQTLADQARIACALERYRLARGKYPDTLEALTPQLLEQVPHDIIGGQPMKYHQTEGHYVLYSVGWNETDDGGKAGKTNEDGDWVLNH